MRIRALVFTLLILLGSSAVAPLAYAANNPSLDSSFHIVPSAHDIDPACPDGAPLSFGAIMEIVQRFINVGISFGVLIFTIIIAWAGFLFIISGVNPEARSSAKKMLENAAIGLLITLTAWLMVDFVMKTLYNPSATFAGKSIGPWNSILGDGPACIIASDIHALFTGDIVASALVVTAGSSTGGTGDLPSRVCSAANAYRGSSTVAGPDGGNKACAWAVNNVLTQGGVRSIGTSNVAQMESLLKQGRGSLIAQASATCGDIVIEAGQSHVGICLNAGCTQVISNSSSKKTFSWISDISFKPSYSSGAGRVYRLTD